METQRRIDRRRFLDLSGKTLVGLTLVACGAPAASPTAAPKPAATTAPAAAPAAAPTVAALPAAPALQPTPVPAVTPAGAAAKAAAQGNRLVIALAGVGTENPFAWNGTASGNSIWDPMYDRLLQRDPVTFRVQPGLALEWKPSSDYKIWTFKLRPGVQFHDNWGELTAEDVKFTVEQNLRKDVLGGGAPFFRNNLDKIETPDKYTFVLHLKSPSQEVPAQFAPRTGYQNITSKKHLESVGEEKARQHPIGSGPFKLVESRQGDFYRFEAVPNHWRQSAGFKELVVRYIPEQATRLSALRAGEIDITQLTGDFLDKAKQAGFRVHEVKDATPYTIVLPGQTLPGRPDYCPTCPWAGDPNDSKSLENARKVRLALSLAVNKQAIIDGLWRGYGTLSPFVSWYYPMHAGFSQEWKPWPYDPQRAKQLLAEAGYRDGFEITVLASPTQVTDAGDVMEAVALDWEKVGIKVKRRQEAWTSMSARARNRDTGRTAFIYGVPGPEDTAATSWIKTVSSKGAFYFFGESAEYDRMLDAVTRELDSDKRVKLEREMGEKMYDDVRVIMLGTKPVTFGVSKQVGNWPTLVATLYENNFEYITWSGQ